MKRQSENITPAAIPDFYGTPPKRRKSTDEVTPPKGGPNSAASPATDFPVEVLDQKFLDALPENDTLTTLYIIRKAFPEHNSRVPPVIFQSQVYYTIANRTTADQDLTNLAKQRKIRLFRVSDSNDVAILFVQDYKELAEAQKANVDLSEKRTLALIDGLVDLVLEQHHEMRLTKDLLRLKLDIKSDEEFRTLVQLGFMVLNDANSYWAAIPNFGPIYGVCLKARAEIMAFLKKQKFSEMPQAMLEKKLLNSSSLPTLYHIREMIRIVKE